MNLPGLKAKLDPQIFLPPHRRSQKREEMESLKDFAGKINIHFNTLLKLYSLKHGKINNLQTILKSLPKMA